MFLNLLFSKLPFDIIRLILLYDSHFVIRSNNKIVCINKIPKEDFRFMLYNNIPKIYKVSPNSWKVIITTIRRYFIIKHNLRENLTWEYSFLIFSKDPHSNIICSIPESIINFN
jgi:hypothetical protein